MTEFDSLVGQQIDQYKVIRLIGQGGMAAVYLAHDLTLDREVVLKTMLPALAQNEELMRRFEREARATARLEHPNIVPIYVTGTTPDGQPYIAMQYISGGSLSDYLRQLTAQKQWVSTIYALSIVRQIADALRVAHQAEIIHRDLKPSNILLRRWLSTSRSNSTEGCVYSLWREVHVAEEGVVRWCGACSVGQGSLRAA